jgi:hypothetical protein
MPLSSNLNEALAGILRLEGQRILTRYLAPDRKGHAKQHKQQREFENEPNVADDAHHAETSGAGWPIALEHTALTGRRKPPPFRDRR